MKRGRIVYDTLCHGRHFSKPYRVNMMPPVGQYCPYRLAFTNAFVDNCPFDSLFSCTVMKIRLHMRMSE